MKLVKRVRNGKKQGGKTQKETGRSGCGGVGGGGRFAKLQTVFYV